MAKPESAAVIVPSSTPVANSSPDGSTGVAPSVSIRWATSVEDV